MTTGSRSLRVLFAVGILTFGRTLRWRNEAVATRWIVIGFPLVPIGLAYITDTKTGECVPARWRWSIFLRSIASIAICLPWVVAVFFVLGGIAADRKWHLTFAMRALWTAGGMIGSALCALAWWKLRTPTSRESEERALCHQYFGIGMWPDIMTKEAARRALATLDTATGGGTEPYRANASATAKLRERLLEVL